MEIAVADMADDRGEQAQAADVGPRGAHASRERRDGHADIGRKDLRARPQAPYGPIGVMARLPELGSVLWALGPSELPSSFGIRDFGESLDLLARGGIRAVEFEKERRRLGQSKMRIGIAGSDLHLVEQLDAGKRKPDLESGNRGVAGALDRSEGADGRQDRLGDAVELQREAGDDAEGPFRTDQETGEIVTCRGLPGPAPRMDHAAVGEHRGKRDPYG